MDRIRVSGISKAYGGKTVLRGLSLEIRKNAVTCIMGPSGCGKTTLIRLMTGLEKADEGEIQGIDLTKIAFVFQEDRLIPHLSALSNAILPLKNNAENRERGAQVLKLLGLSGEERKKAGRLSGGMARRVAIARAMLSGADTVFMDEPFKGLDKENREKAIEFVKSYAMAHQKTLIVVTHSAYEAELLNAEVFHMPVS